MYCAAWAGTDDEAEMSRNMSNKGSKEDKVDKENTWDAGTLGSLGTWNSGILGAWGGWEPGILGVWGAWEPVILGSCAPGEPGILGS